MIPCKVYTTIELRKMFDVSARTLRRWVQDGKIPAPVVRGRWEKAAIDKLLAANSGQYRTEADKSGHRTSDKFD